MAEPKRWRIVTNEEYYLELSLLGVYGAKRKRLRSSYFSFLGQLSGIAREQRKLIARLPYVRAVSKLIIGDRVRELDRQRTRILQQMRHIRTTELPELEEQIRTELREFQQKIKPPPKPKPPKLHRIHIRIYNMERAPTPSGMFQGFFEIDGIIDPETGLVDWTWWLTKEEIEMAKTHFVGYFKGLAKWRSPSQVSLAYFDDPEGIPHETETVSYKRAYIKNVPPSFIAKAEALTVGELIIGESSQAPEPNLEPTSQNMGVFFERAMIIGADGSIKWDEIRNRRIKLTEAQVKRVKEELKIK